MKKKPSTPCHKCCKQEVEGKCELTTISASQFSSFVLIVIYIGYELLHIQFFQNRHPEDVTAVVKWFMLIFYITSIIYYFLGSWYFEEEYIDDLRGLRIRAYFYIQWIIRITILVYLGCFVTITNHFIDYDINKVETLALIKYLVALYALFLLWDFAIILGGGYKLIKDFVRTDVLGMVAVTCGLFYDTFAFNILLIIMACWMILAVNIWYVMRKAKLFAPFIRIFNFNQVR